MSRIDELSAQLGRARAAHERRPDDAVLELRFHEARACLLAAQLSLQEEESRRRTAELRALQRENAALKASIGARIAAALSSAKPKARRRRKAALGAPLFEGAAA